MPTYPVEAFIGFPLKCPCENYGRLILTNKKARERWTGTGYCLFEGLLKHSTSGYFFFLRCCCFLKAIWTKIVCPCHYERYITYGVSAIAAKCGIRLRQERVLYLSNGEPHLSVSWRTIEMDHGKIDDCTCNQDNGLILSARTYVQWRCQKSCKALLYVEI